MSVLDPSRRLPIVTTYDLTNTASRALWDRLFLPSVDLHAGGVSGLRLQTGDQARDVFSGLLVQVLRSPLGGAFRWGGVSPSAFGVYTAMDPVTKRRLVRLAGSGNLTPPLAPGGLYHAITLNDAGVGERVYVVLQGTAACECTGTPPDEGDKVASDAVGRATVAVAGNLNGGTMALAPVPMGGLSVGLVTLAALQVIV